MSHFVTVRTEIRERAALIEALRDLSHDVQEDAGSAAGLSVRGDRREEERADIVVRVSARADIGFRKVGDVYEVVADWYRVEQDSSLRRRSFLEDVQQRYAYRIVLEQAKEQNLVVEEETLDSGEIVLVLSERG